MAESLIDEIVDRGKLKADQQFIVDNLDVILSKFEAIKQYKISIGGPGGVGQTVADLKKVKEAQDDIAKATAKLKLAQSEYNEQLQGFRLQTAEANKAAKEAAKDQLGLNTEYERGTKRLAELKRELKDLAFQGKEASKEFKALESEFQTLDATIRKAETSVGEFGRNVGNYQASANTIIEALKKQEGRLQSLTGSYQSFGQKIEVQRNIVLGFSKDTNSAEYKRAVAELITLEIEYEKTGAEVEKTRSVVEGFRRVQEAGSTATGNAASVQKKMADETAKLALEHGKNSDVVKVVSAAVQENGKIVKEAGEAASGAAGKTNLLGKGFSFLKTAANILPGVGIAGIFGLIGTAIVELIAKMAGAGEATKRLAEQQERLVAFGKDVNENVAKEGTELKVLRAKIEDTNLPMATRIANVKSLQDLYPQYFKDLKQEDILNGNAAAAYDQASNAILRKARATAASKKLEEIATKKGDLQDSLGEDVNKFQTKIDQIRANNAKVGEGGFSNKAAVLGTVTADFKNDTGEKIKAIQELTAEEKRYTDKVVNNTDITTEQYRRDNKESKAKHDKQLKDFADFNAQRILIERQTDVIRLQEIIKANEAITANEDEALDKRIAAIYTAGLAQTRIAQLQLKEQEDAINAAEKKEISQKGLTEAQKVAIQRKYIAERIQAEEKYAIAIRDIQAKGVKDTEAILNKQAEDAKLQGPPGSAPGRSSIQDELDRIASEGEKKRKKLQEQQDKDIDQRKAFLAKLREFGFEAIDTIQSIGDGNFDEQKNRVQEEIDLIEKKKQADIDRVNATTLSEQDKAAKLTAINIKAQAEREALERRQREIDQKKAVFDRAVTIGKIIANTALAVVASLPNIPLAIAVGAIGALQIAQVLATPIPKFKTGKTSSYQGPAIVGDGGVPEFIKRADGSIEMTPATDTLTYLGSKDMVFPDLMAMMKANAMPAIGQMPVTMPDGSQKVVDTLNARMDSLEQTIKGKVENHWSIQNGELKKFVKHDQAWVEWVAKSV